MSNKLLCLFSSVQVCRCVKEKKLKRLIKGCWKDWIVCGWQRCISEKERKGFGWQPSISLFIPVRYTSTPFRQKQIYIYSFQVRQGLSWVISPRWPHGDTWSPWHHWVTPKLEFHHIPLPFCWIAGLLPRFLSLRHGNGTGLHWTWLSVL